MWHQLHVLVISAISVVFHKMEHFRPQLSQRTPEGWISEENKWSCTSSHRSVADPDLSGLFLIKHVLCWNVQTNSTGCGFFLSDKEKEKILTWILTKSGGKKQSCWFLTFFGQTKINKSTKSQAWTDTTAKSNPRAQHSGAEDPQSTAWLRNMKRIPHGKRPSSLSSAPRTGASSAGSVRVLSTLGRSDNDPLSLSEKTTTDDISIFIYLRDS